jgi:tetratricopeptide (TPR) repeat protein
MKIDEAIAAYKNGELHEAGRLFREALATALTDEDAGWCEVYLGGMARDAGNRDAALAYLTNALRRELPIGLRINAHYHAGVMLYETQEPRGAVNHLAEVIRLAPESPEALEPDSYADSVFFLGWSQYELGQYEDALQSLFAATDLRLADNQQDRKRRALIAVMSGLALYRLERFTDAVSCLEAALRPEAPLDPENRATGEFYLALGLYKLGRYQEAIALLRRVLGEGQEEAITLRREFWAAAAWSLGRIHCASDEYAAALPWLQKALAQADDELLRKEPIGSFAADCLVELGRPEEALPFAKEAYQRNPDDALRAICFAKALGVLGERSQALAILEAVQVEGLVPWEHERLLAHKCWLLAMLGERPQYETCYRALRTRYPECRYLTDPTRTRWLPPPEELRWPDEQNP